MRRFYGAVNWQHYDDIEAIEAERDELRGKLTELAHSLASSRETAKFWCDLARSRSDEDQRRAAADRFLR